MSVPIVTGREEARRMRSEGASYQAIGIRLGVSKTTAARWADQMVETAHYEQVRVRSAERRRERSSKPTPPADRLQSFARVYAAALAEGVDLLEERDAIYEMKCCGRLPVEGCVCVPVREGKAA